MQKGLIHASNILTLRRMIHSFEALYKKTFLEIKS